MRVYNRTENLGIRRNLTLEAPPAEVILWGKIRGAQVANAKFRRQYSVGKFVLDFYCPEVKLGIELDGASHESDQAQGYDSQRQVAIEAYGIVQTHLIRVRGAHPPSPWQGEGIRRLPLRLTGAGAR